VAGDDIIALIEEEPRRAT